MTSRKRRRKVTSKINTSECFKRLVNAQAFKNAFEGKKEVEGEGGAKEKQNGIRELPKARVIELRDFS